jgi:hypothetical protein
MFHIIPKFVILEQQAIQHTQCMGTFINYHHTKFHMHGSDSSIVITNKLKAKRIIGMTAMLLYNLQKYYFNTSNIFCQDLLAYIISGRHTKWRQCRSHLTSSCVLHVDITNCKKLKMHGAGIVSKGIMLMPSVTKIDQLFQKL